MRPRISIWGCVRPYVRQSVRPCVRMSVTLRKNPRDASYCPPGLVYDSPCIKKRLVNKVCDVCDVCDFHDISSFLMSSYHTCNDSQRKIYAMVQSLRQFYWGCASSLRETNVDFASFQENRMQEHENIARLLHVGENLQEAKNAHNWSTIFKISSICK